MKKQVSSAGTKYPDGSPIFVDGKVKPPASGSLRRLDVDPGPNVIDIIALQPDGLAVRKVDALQAPVPADVTKPYTPAMFTLMAVEGLLRDVVAGEAMLDINWLKLGALLEDVQTHDYWRGKYKSFGEYIMELQTKYKRGRSQLYNYIAVVHALRPVMGDEQIMQMGIAKARVLTEGIKAYGSLPPSAIETALDPGKTAENVKEALFKGTDADAKGEWYALMGFPVSKDERATLDNAFELARRTDPILPNTWKPWQRLKECLLRFAMEYANTYSGEVDTFEEKPDEEVSF